MDRSANSTAHFFALSELKNSIGKVVDAQIQRNYHQLKI